MPDERGPRGSECVTWMMLAISLAAVFVGNAAFSLVLFCVIGSGGNSASVNNTIHLDADRDKSRLIEDLARNEDARLHSSTTSLQPRSGD